MKLLILFFGVLLSGISVAQSDSTMVQTDSTQIVEDSIDIYVINNTNRLLQVGENFAIEFRDLRSLTELHNIRLSSKADVEKFFATCYKVLDKDVKIVGQHYTISRNVLSRNILRIEHDDTAYFMLTYSTLEKMEKAFKRYTSEQEG